VSQSALGMRLVLSDQWPPEGGRLGPAPRRGASDMLAGTMKRAMARQAEAEREKRAKIINAEGESLAAAALGDASDIMMAHPLALQLRNLQSLVEIGVDKNTTVVFPAPLMSTIGELGSFLAREAAAATPLASQAPKAAPALPNTPADAATPESKIRTSRGEIPNHGAPFVTAGR
jgi:hypothetical protein